MRSHAFWRWTNKGMGTRKMGWRGRNKGRLGGREVMREKKNYAQVSSLPLKTSTRWGEGKTYRVQLTIFADDGEWCVLIHAPSGSPGGLAAGLLMGWG